MPLTLIVPDVGCSRSAMTRRNVVLPQPEGPMKETNSPLAISRLTSVRATTSPSRVEKVRPSPLAETTVVRSDPRRRDAGALHRAGRGDLLPGRERTVDGAARLARHELSVARPRPDLVLDDGDLAVRQRVAGQAHDLKTFEDVVVDDRLLGLGGDGLCPLGVPHHDIGVGADHDRPLP